MLGDGEEIRQGTWHQNTEQYNEANIKLHFGVEHQLHLVGSQLS